MPRKIILSTMAHSAEGSSSLQADLREFESQNGMDIAFQELDYSTGWSDFMRIAGAAGTEDRAGAAKSGAVETRLAHAIPLLWDDIFTSPHPDLEALYDKHITPLARRLNITLSQA